MRLTEGAFALGLFLLYMILWRVKEHELKSLGITSKVLFKDPRPTQRFFSRLEPVMTVWVILLIVGHALFSEATNMARQFNPLDNLTSDILGLFIGLCGLALCRIAQVTIGNSWRVGIDSSAKTAFVTTGIYKHIRNPTYSGLFILCLGVWLIFPTALFTMWILAFYLIMEFQVRCEEEYLEKIHGEAFANYHTRTNRYVPFIY